MSSFESDVATAIDAYAHFEHVTQSVLVTEAVLSAPGPRILYANPAFERMTGWSRQEIVGRTPRVLQGPDTDRKLMRGLKASLKRGESWAGETTNYRRDGTPFILKWTVSPVCDGEGRVRRFVAIQEDVTELRQHERREAHLQAVTQQLMAAASEGIVVTDADQKITSFGAGAEGIFGWREHEVVGQPLSMLVPERYRSAHAGHVRDFAAQGQGVRHMVERGEVAGLHRDGREFPALITVANLGGQGAQGCIAVVRDLSIRKAYARQLEESERRYRAVFDLTYQFVGLLTADGRVLEANHTALAFFDGTMEAVRGLHFIDTPWFAGSPDVRETVRAALATAAAGEFVRGQMTLQAPDGGERTFDYSIRPVFDAAGAVEYLIPEGRDITELVRSTEALKARKRQLNEAQRIARVGDWHWDIAADRLFWSEQTYRIFGMEPGKEPTYPEFLAAVHPEDRVDVESRVRDALAGREPYALDHRIVLPDGSERIVHEQAEVHCDANGRPIEMIGIADETIPIIRHPHGAGSRQRSIDQTARLGFPSRDDSMKRMVWKLSDHQMDMVGHDHPVIEIIMSPVQILPRSDDLLRGLVLVQQARSVAGIVVFIDHLAQSQGSSFFGLPLGLLFHVCQNGTRQRVDQPIGDGLECSALVEVPEIASRIPTFVSLRGLGHGEDLSEYPGRPRSG